MTLIMTETTLYNKVIVCLTNIQKTEKNYVIKEFVDKELVHSDYHYDGELGPQSLPE